MGKIMKKFVTLLFVALLLCSCANKKKVPSDAEHDGKTYIQLLRDYIPKTKNVGNTTDDKKFDEFLDKVFVESMESDFMTMHFNVIDYKAYGIEKPPVDLGELKYEFDEENFQYMLDQLKELQSFDYDKLSYRQQYDYEALEYSLYETLASMCYYRFAFPLCSGSNIAENMITNFSDYTFYDKESLDDYMECLKDVDRYFDDVLAYTEAQAKDGLPLIDAWIDHTVDACMGTLNKTEDNEYIVSFDKRVDQLDFLSEEEKQKYKEENRQIVLDEVLPSYQKVNDAVEKYRGKAKINNYALYKLDKDYAELVYILKGSNNQSIDEVFQNLEDNLSDLEAEFMSCVYDQNSYAAFNELYNGGGNMQLTGKDCLEYLRTNLAAYYPDLGDVEYTVEELDPDTAPSTVIAYYWPSPIDNHNQNIIRTNPNNMDEGFESYGTLSHEGFPGHLYQHVYYYKTDPHEYRSAISFIGYTEGWAVNAQYYAFRFSGIDDDYAASALFFEDAYYFFLYSLIDIGVNYYGWTAKDIVKYFNDDTMFSFNDENAEYFREILIEMPGVYCSYGLGCSNFFSLCKDTQKKLGDKFDYIAYHDTLMKNGPLPFNILKGAVDEYIGSVQ